MNKLVVSFFGRKWTFEADGEFDCKFVNDGTDAPFSPYFVSWLLDTGWRARPQDGDVVSMAYEWVVSKGQDYGVRLDSFSVEQEGDFVY